MMTSSQQRKDEFTFRTSEATIFCTTLHWQTLSEYNLRSTFCNEKMSTFFHLTASTMDGRRFRVISEEEMRMGGSSGPSTRISILYLKLSHAL